jgi:hypothetical protein
MDDGEGVRVPALALSSFHRSLLHYLHPPASLLPFSPPSHCLFPPPLPQPSTSVAPMNLSIRSTGSPSRTKYTAREESEESDERAAGEVRVGKEG